MAKRISIIGLGSIGLRHARNLLAMGHIVHGFDPSDIARNKAADIGVKSWSDDVDAYVIASPTYHHAQDIQACFNLNGIGVFVEKPIAHRKFDTVDWVDMVGYNLRFHSSVKQAKVWMDHGLIGDPIWANFVCGQYNDRPAYLRDGVILNWSHEIDLALYLLGDAELAAKSVQHNTDGQDVMADILLTHGNDCRTSIHIDYNSRPEQRYFRIVGTKGYIFGSLTDPRYAAIHTADASTQTLIYGTDSFDENYKEEMQAFLDRIDGKETIGCTGEEALKVLDICLKVKGDR